MARVPKDKYKDNPLVSIDGARVRAAIGEGGYSVMSVARAIGEDHRTLDSIVQGKQARTRKHRLKRLSKFLNVSEAWLSGEDEAPVDALPPWDLGAPAVFGDEVFNLDQNFIPHLVGGDVLDAPFYQLAWARMVENVIGAWRRDIEEGVPEAQSALEEIDEIGSSKGPWTTVSQAVQQVMAVVWFRPACLLPPDPNGGLPLVFGSRHELVRTADVWAKSASEMLHIMLGPWFEGRQQVDYGVLLWIIRWTRGPMITRNRAARLINTEV